MRALVVATGRKISPFDEPPSTVQYAATTVGEAVRSFLVRRGIEVVDVDAAAPVAMADGDWLVLPDHLFVSNKCLGDFLVRALDVKGATRLALCRTPSVDYVRPCSSVVVEPFDTDGPGARPAKPLRGQAGATERVAYDLFYIPTGMAPPSSSAGALLQALREVALRVVVPKGELGVRVRLPLLGDASKTTMVLPVTSTVAAHVEHWVHALWLNHLAFGVEWMETARDHKAWAAWRGALAAPWSLPALLRSFVKKGRGVRIHPTANVEASILGDGVVIGARANVRNSILGPGVEVGDNATLLSTTAGAGAYVTPRTCVVWCTLYPGAVVSNIKLQVSVVGRGAATNLWAGLIDAKFQGAIDVSHDGGLASTERSFLGSCLGHGAYVGAKVLLLPGREVPTGAYITMRPDEVISTLPADLVPGVPMVRDAGTLVPLERLLPPRR